MKSFISTNIRATSLLAIMALSICPAVAEVEAVGSLNEESSAGWEVSSTDLINVGAPSLSAVSGQGEGMRVAVTDGKAGGALTADTQASEYMSYDNVSYSVTYELNTEAHPNGYDIDEICTYAGWSQWRVNQVYEVVVKTVASDREPIAQVSYTPVVEGLPKLADASTKVSIKNNDGSLLATGVTAITFTFTGDTENPQAGASALGAMYREIDVIGKPTP
jgi:hypothetical protein